ncbi:MAG: WYL domain-containing protein [Atopobiaceae bacterium]|jgi:proteasome accessory factor B|nr:WYL domain-containing protein [Atopobiaceae bacterium]MCI2173672.1 WYL domain-containing protein [Atopobiaceae bacterium]MCI2207686.1 WYL domain-containing protein [Atopobiaceae bacterium]
MDLFDEDEEPRLNGDEAQSRRLLSIAIFFQNANGPVTSDEVAARFYGPKPSATIERSFNRDRKRLALCGLVITDVGHGSDHAWAVDKDASYLGGSSLSDEDAAVLEVACRPLVSDPSFVYRDELRLALAKVDRCFSGTRFRESRGTSRLDRRSEALVASFTSRTPVDVTYRDARGREGKRRLRVYGFFGLRGRNYVVAARMDADGSTSSIRDYRCDRFSSVTPVKDQTYEIPEDFFVEDHIFLPFQIGPTTTQACFLVAPEDEARVRGEACGWGSWTKEGDAIIWRVDVSSVDIAASWAIAEAIRPLSPVELVDTWTRALEGVASDARN